MRYKLARYIYPLLILLIGVNASMASPGDLDTTFSQDGRLVEMIGTVINVSDRITDIVIQPDGKIVALGNGFSNGNFSILARFNPDGTLDASFGNGGKILVTTAGFNDVALQPDGKIVAAGSGLVFPSDIIVARFNSDGSPDATFDGDGVATVDFGGTDTAISVAVQPDGKIVAGGPTRPASGTSNIAIVRFDTNGALDTSFDTDGKVTTDIANNNDDVKSLFLQPDGRIAVAGTTTVALNNRDFMLVRYDANGTLDTTFDSDGKLTTDFFNSYDDMAAAILQPDGKILAVGSTRIGNQGGPDFTVTRYNTDGSLDTSFDGDGKAMTEIPSANLASPRDIAMQSDGKVLVSGYVNFIPSAGGDDFIVLRYNTDGSLDTSFDGEGWVITNVNGSIDEAAAVAVQPDGKIVAAGTAHQASLNQDDCGVVRYNPDGSLDTSFDGDGKVVMNLGSANAPAQGLDVAVQADGKPVFAGWSGSQSNTNFALLRYLPSGVPDSSFDGDGQLMTDFLGNRDQAFAMALQADGKIVAAGYASNGTNDYGALARYNANGSLDTTFGSGGKVITTILGTYDYFYDVAIQPDGKIVAVGFGYNGANSDLAIMRFNVNGTADTSFGSGGKTIVSILSSEDEGYAVALQPDGKIVATGSAYNGTGWIFAAVRVNANGTLDSTFDNDGRVTTPILSSRQAATAVAIQPDGKIVAGGTGDDNFNRTVALLRYNTNGSLDTTFDGDGIVSTASAIADALVIQPNGKIVVGGAASSNFAIFRYNTDGSLDGTFGSGGKSIFDISNNVADRVFGLALDANNAIVAAGESSTFFAAARVLGDAPAAKASFDFDGDRRSDISVFRPSNGNWYLQQSTAGPTGVQWGIADDKLVPADYDGDNRTDIAIYRNGTWHVLNSTAGYASIAFGTAEDIPTPADYDADGKADIAVFRPSTGIWYVQRSTAGFTSVAFGQQGDRPVPADYDGDGKSDVAVNRAGIWYINRSTAGFIGVQFGAADDKLVQGDYTGDGRADIAVYRPSNGFWYALSSEDSAFLATQFGSPGDIPAAGDYDGDGKLDQTVFRPADATWYLNRSTAGFTAIPFGAAADRPVPSAFVP